MSKLLDSKYILPGSLMKRSPRDTQRREILVIEYQTKEDNPDVVTSCLFTDESFLTAHTNKGYIMIREYFERAYRYVSLPQPEVGTLVFEVRFEDGEFSMYVAAGDYEDKIDYEHLVDFIDAVNTFIQREGKYYIS